MDNDWDREQPVELDEDHCASCGELLAADEAGRPVCRRCDLRLERELAAYLSFVAVCRE